MNHTEGLKDAVKWLLDIVSESKGVAGYHKNGDLAPWSEFDDELSDAGDALCRYEAAEATRKAPDSSLAAWEEEAEAFHLASGFLRPGKDPGPFDDWEYRRRRDELYKVWCAAIGYWQYRQRDHITALCRRAYETSKAHGWKHDNDGQAIALMHSELSEALEAMRNPGCKDEHLPDLDPVGLELADVLIRVFDFCGARGIDLATCLKAKMDYNDKRPMKHGGKMF